MTAPLRIVVDADVLCSAVLRDTLLQSGERGLCQLHWSPPILDEMSESLVATGRAAREQVARLRALLERAFPEAMVGGHALRMGNKKHERGDGHVAAVASKAKADFLLTGTPEEFPDLPAHVEAVSPDAFLIGLFDRDPDPVVVLLKHQAVDLHAPPLTLDQLLSGMHTLTPRFVEHVRAYLE